MSIIIPPIQILPPLIAENPFFTFLQILHMKIVAKNVKS